MAKLKIVKIVRAKQREGLIRARLLGYEAAVGEVLVFLDSHVECAPGKSRPIHRILNISYNRTMVVSTSLMILSCFRSCPFSITLKSNA